MKLLFKSVRTSIYVEHNNGLSYVVKSDNENNTDYTKAGLLENEYEITRNLQLNGVRKAISKTIFNNNHAITLEYISGKNLKEFFQKKVSLATFLIISIKITEALSDIHLNKIIHKDISPKN